MRMLACTHNALLVLVRDEYYIIQKNAGWDVQAVTYKTQTYGYTQALKYFEKTEGPALWKRGHDGWDAHHPRPPKKLDSHTKNNGPVEDEFGRCSECGNPAASDSCGCDWG